MSEPSTTLPRLFHLPLISARAQSPNPQQRVLAWVDGGWEFAIYQPGRDFDRWEFDDYGCLEEDVEFWIPEPPPATTRESRAATKTYYLKD